MITKWLYWLLPISWMMIIFISSSTPYEKQDIKPLLSGVIDLSFLEPFLRWVSFHYNQSEISIAALGINSFVEFFIRKGAHFGVFFLLMIFFYIALQKNVSWNLHKILFVSFSFTLAYAIMDEMHQGLTPNRTPYVGDVLIDGLGATVASVFLFYWQRKRM